mmetsp:Transcript_1678/g.6670  ORF Transcript_1678/g.6670 Transcript_1678/m.6670 type:complete len:222 (-) Transcript_1678:1127-1792(-)
MREREPNLRLAAFLPPLFERARLPLRLASFPPPTRVHGRALRAPNARARRFLLRRAVFPPLPPGDERVRRARLRRQVGALRLLRRGGAPPLALPLAQPLDVVVLLPRLLRVRERAFRLSRASQSRMARRTLLRRARALFLSKPRRRRRLRTRARRSTLGRTKIRDRRRRGTTRDLCHRLPTIQASREGARERSPRLRSRRRPKFYRRTSSPLVPQNSRRRW